MPVRAVRFAGEGRGGSAGSKGLKGRRNRLIWPLWAHPVFVARYVGPADNRESAVSSKAERKESTKSSFSSRRATNFQRRWSCECVRE